MLLGFDESPFGSRVRRAGWGDCGEARRRRDEGTRFPETAQGVQPAGHVAQLNLQPSWGINESTGSWMFGVVVPRMQAAWESTDGLAIVPEYRAQLRNTQEAPLHRFDARTGELMRRDLFEIGLPWLERSPVGLSALRVGRARSRPCLVCHGSDHPRFARAAVGTSFRAGRCRSTHQLQDS